MRRLAVLLPLLAGLLSCGPEEGLEGWAARSDGLTAVSNFGSNPGGLSLFLHEPANLGTGAPLVVALHGCTQTAAAYANTGWNALADQHRFLVAYPQTTANGACFEWFSGAQQSRSGAQVTSLLQAVQHLVTTKGVDASRVYVTGLSAGGAMANVLLAVAPDVFSRGAVIAGLPFACATTQTQAFGCMTGGSDRTATQWGDLVRAAAGTNPAPRVALWHGTSDGTVAFANLQEEVEQWTNVNSIDATADATSTVGAATRREYRNGSGVTVVESWTVTGMNHGTPVDPGNGCGTAGAFVLDVGLCSSRFAAEFFGLASGGTVMDAGVAVDAGVTVDAGTPAVDAGTPVTCLGEWYATNVNHFSAGRAALCSGRYCAVGSGALLGDSLDMTWVRQVAAGRYEAGRCGGAVDGGTDGGGGSTGGGGGSATGGGGGSTATGGGGGSTATGGGGGTTATGGGGGSTATGGGGGSTATGGGGGSTATGGGGGGVDSPGGCGCAAVDPMALLVPALVLLSRRRPATRSPRAASRGSS